MPHLFVECARLHHSNQGALILKIVSGKYPPVTEYSNPLRKLVSRMLTRDNKARPSISQVLMSRAVVEKAQELDISLPADILEGATKHDERGAPLPLTPRWYATRW